MITLDFMIVADYVRVDQVGHGTALHIMGAGIDTICTPVVPTAQPLGIAARLHFDSTEESGAIHQLRLVFQSSDGQLLSAGASFQTPNQPDDMPVHWKRAANVAMQVTVPIPKYGDYSIELMVGDQHLKSIDFRVIPVPAS